MTHDSALLLSVLRQLSGTQAVALAQYLLKLMTKYAGKLLVAFYLPSKVCIVNQQFCPSLLSFLGSVKPHQAFWQLWCSASAHV